MSGSILGWPWLLPLSLSAPSYSQLILAPRPSLFTGLVGISFYQDPPALPDSRVALDSPVDSKAGPAFLRALVVAAGTLLWRC